MRILFNSFNGRYSDSPRRVHEALLAARAGHEHRWLVDPAHASTFPEGTPTVPISTDLAVEALQGADLVVSNGHLEMDWQKRSGATYVQLWHGTPLKRIHADAIGGPPGLLEHLSQDVERWDVLLSPNPYSTRTMRTAFRWGGEVLETGYPRNDVLVGEPGDEIRRRVRHELELADDVTAVLYTPTWRDDAFWAGGAAAAALALDVEHAVRELGDAYVLLLRVHYKLTDLVAEVLEHPSVRDVSTVPEVSDLYLAADAMVTDYSSTMFDFAVTGKPLLFYAYDFERYRDELRGFYFDLSLEPPGPFVATTDDLVRELADLPSGVERHADAYTRFRETYCPWDDGGATGRFLERFFADVRVPEAFGGVSRR